MIRKNMNLDEVRAFIQEQTPETKIYLGGDSERFQLNGVWHADYVLVVVVHKNGKNGCKVFGGIVRERDYDQQKDKPRMRLMNEVMKVCQLYLDLEDILEDREVEVHLDINPDLKHGSSCVINEAVGYVKGMCNVVPLVKPHAWCASYAADRFKDAIMNRQIKEEKIAI
jgi:predicted RNase H-related nuclease YkuK (DUF458 family)